MLLLVSSTLFFKVLDGSYKNNIICFMASLTALLELPTLEVIIINVDILPILQEVSFFSEEDVDGCCFIMQV